MKPYDICLCMGRFQPFHWGHFDLIQAAMDQGEQVIILLGSHLAPPSIKNPWTSKEREQMIWKCLSLSEQSRILFIPICDFELDEKWAATVHKEVSAVTSLDHNIAMVGYHDEGQKFFAKHFSEWDYIEKSRRPYINATDIRDAYFNQLPETDYLAKVPFCTLLDLREFRQRPIYQQLCQEFKQSHR